MAKGSKGARKIGRDKAKCLSYKTHKTREKNKLKRILPSNGLAYAQAYADKHGLSTFLKSLANTK